MTVQSEIRARYERRRRRIGGLLIGSVVLTSNVVAFGYWGFRLNLTPSAALGIWRIEAIERPVRKGDRVFVCPPLSGALQEGLMRGYLRRGLCAGGVAPLIKTVSATSGQFVSITGLVRIDGEVLPHSRLMEFDGEGRPLSPHAGGLIPPGAVYLHSDFPGSFDSRYFGPVSTTNILGLAQEVWTREP
jgi:conjugative transfer signal peptidase TraF